MAFRRNKQPGINEKQEYNCLNCAYNPMTDTEFATARLTGKVDFICGHNGMFKVKDINHGNKCRHHIKSTLSHLLQ